MCPPFFFVLSHPFSPRWSQSKPLRVQAEFGWYNVAGDGNYSVMTRPSYEANDCRMTIYPHLGIGWQTTVDQVHREVTMQLRLFCVKLPIKRRIPYSDVVHVAVACREAWWTERKTPRGIPQDSFMSSTDGRGPLTTWGWRHDILMTLTGGTTIKIETVRSPRTAKEIEKQLRHRIGLPEVH